MALDQFSDIFVLSKRKNLEYFNDFLTFLDANPPKILNFPKNLNLNKNSI